MSLIPLLYSDWWEDLGRPHRLFDQDFGQGIHQNQLMHPTILEQFMQPYLDRRPRPQSSVLYYRPWGELLRNREEGGTSTVQADKDKFQVILDVQQFKPEEIDVKVVDKSVVVEAKHEEKKDEHGWISRQFVRKYLIPEQCDIDQVTSTLSSDGVLTINAPKKNLESQNERSIKIEQTGKPALQNEEKKAEKKAEKKEAKKN
ncbi:protein lethal(2)essential for life-like [Linepithema humile]|uniref:protein lethal(2)essential for life-like n=1 Tax=Linepithema humile TaxID=83485 RepID=UPI000623AC24|nr:PREDICTED: protein lethal(2)essential for life-like [Linepithema humile]